MLLKAVGGLYKELCNIRKCAVAKWKLADSSRTNNFEIYHAFKGRHSSNSKIKKKQICRPTPFTIICFLFFNITELFRYKIWFIQILIVLAYYNICQMIQNNRSRSLCEQKLKKVAKNAEIMIT